MPTPNVPVQTPGRSALRLVLGEHPGRDRLDGGWWPRSRDLAVELASLVDQFPPELGRVVRALYSPPDWDPAPRRVPVTRGYVKVGSFPGDDTHLIVLRTFDRADISLVVVPSDFSSAQGEEAMLAAATPGYAHSASCLLETVTDQFDVDPQNHWA